MTASVLNRPNTHEMIVVHRVFRRESRLLPGLVRSVRPGDVERAGILAAHLRDYQMGLHEHHTGEDELIWPLLLARVDLEADLVLRMEAQHTKVAANLERVGDLLAVWEEGADETARDELAEALTEHQVLVHEHLEEEETSVLPLIERHLTAAEWDALGERFATETPKSKLLFFLGALLEEADPSEQAQMLGILPLPARLAWRTIGRRHYARRIRRVRTTS